MKRSLLRAAKASPLLAILMLGRACHADEAVLDDRLWFCDPHAATNQCGTRDGRALKCYSAEGLGGGAFCTEACDPGVPTADSKRWLCTGSGALLRICTPSSTGKPCPEGLACYRTELNPLLDDGLCLPMTVCSSDADCETSGDRTVCIASVVNAAYNQSQLLNTGNLECVQPCDDPDAGSSDCGEREACLSDFYSLPNTPRVCVPTCSKSNPCPPNFFCLNEAGPAYPALCSPGLPGYRCSHEEDCAVGDCRDTGAGFAVCTLDCDPDEDFCAVLDSARGPAVCERSMCVIKSPFAGAFCMDDGDCEPGATCSDFDPYNPNVPRNPLGHECHQSCGGPGDCGTRGVMPFVCLKHDGAYGDCYPADFGLACVEGTDACMGQLSCLHPTSGGAADAVCTIPCESDATCAAYNLTQFGLCKDGICQLRAVGDACDVSNDCPSTVCDESGRCR